MTASTEVSSIRSSFADQVFDAEYQSLNLIASALDSYDANSEEDFATAIEIVVRNRFNQAEIAAEFKVSEGTVSRWRRGKSCPPKYARATIVEQLREKLIHSASPEQKRYMSKIASE